MYIDQLQQQNVKLSSRVRRLKKRMGHYDRCLKKIVWVSQRLDLARESTATMRKREVTLDQ
jgi:hypothetical protein